MNASSTENADIGTLTLETIRKATGFNKWMYETILPFLQGEILEIGSGIGNISQYVVQDGFSITLSDINSEYCGILSKSFIHFSNVKDILSIDLQHPDFIVHYSDLREKFDTIFLLNVIEHIETDRLAVQNCRFMLRKGGRLIVLAPAYPLLYCRFDKMLGHFRRYTKKSLYSLFQSSLFDQLNCWHFNFAGIAGWLFFGKIMQHKMIGDRNMSAFEKCVPLFKLIDRILFNTSGLSIIVTGRKKD